MATAKTFPEIWQIGTVLAGHALSRKARRLEHSRCIDLSCATVIASKCFVRRYPISDADRPARLEVNAFRLRGVGKEHV